MTRVLIASAVHGGENVGGDAILAAIVEHLRGVEPGMEIAVVTRDPDPMGQRLGISASEFRGLRNRLAAYRAIASTDVLIGGGGGGALIAEYTYGLKGLVTGHPRYPMTMLLAAELMGKATMVYGAGVEEVTFAPARFFIRHIYNRADVVTVRDEDSRLRLVERYGVTVPSVIATADPVLSMRVPGSAEIRSILEDRRIATGGDPFVVINFAYGADRREQLLDFVARMTDHVVDAFGARVLFGDARRGSAWNEEGSQPSGSVRPNQNSGFSVYTPRGDGNCE